MLVVGAGNSGAEIAFEVSREVTRPGCRAETLATIPVVLGSVADRLLTPPYLVLRLARADREDADRPEGSTEDAAIGSATRTGQIQGSRAAGVERVPRTVGVRDGLPAAR